MKVKSFVVLVGPVASRPGLDLTAAMNVLDQGVAELGDITVHDLDDHHGNGSVVRVVTYTPVPAKRPGIPGDL